ncbi:MAG: DUF6384 family protein [Bosea sp. (in: a-proteobacteria)]
MSSATEMGRSVPKAGGTLDDLMLAMDVVDTLRHREDLVARELGSAGREDALLEKLRDIYRQQGIAVPDHILKDGVKALKEQRFVYQPPGQGFKRTLATLYVRRSIHGKRALGTVAALGLAWGAWHFAVVQPERQAAEITRTELTQTLPAKLSALVADITALSADVEARGRTQSLKADAERALQSGDRDAAAKAIAGLGALRDVLAQEYVLTIVSRPGAETGIWRRPPRNPLSRNHYLIVEAITADGRKLALPVRNEETGETETVTMFGMRVPQEMFDRIARDKRDDGIVQFNRFGVKRRGQMTAEYLMPFEGGMITKW